MKEYVVYNPNYLTGYFYLLVLIYIILLVLSLRKNIKKYNNIGLGLLVISISNLFYLGLFIGLKAAFMDDYLATASNDVVFLSGDFEDSGFQELIILIFSYIFLIASYGFKSDERE